MARIIVITEVNSDGVPGFFFYENENGFKKDFQRVLDSDIKHYKPTVTAAVMAEVPRMIQEKPNVDMVNAVVELAFARQGVQAARSVAYLRERALCEMLQEAYGVECVSLGEGFANDLGWQCEKSPFGYCFYDDNNDPAHDQCIACGDPEERK